ncbi:hypothetical protein BT96DRAFT_913804 [Gymnopus androsaceus JB14]|uniref:G-patch domain-containing protein n=1 Tax=Gymnopus androsaceus JB14 TaxID=1447944 RepID=A0A6A4IJ74_9AGAR|nr:hypothetical protein BT96DRAFT_913804 [Gymnopus androsaceus JB14]
MGLAGRKVKQRIGPDPRNLTWADDASKFGASYLAKFGWDSSKGLGAEGQGRTSHIKVSQKLDMLGIGAAQSKDPNGIAWKQNKDFESLLKRLNENPPATETAESKDVDMDKDDQKESKEERKKRKREEKEQKKEGKKRKREENEDEEQNVKKRAKSDEDDAPKADETVEVKPVVMHRRRALVSSRKLCFSFALIRLYYRHRARAIAAKSISSKSAASISEVLGIAPSSSTPTPAATPSGTLTPLDQDHGLEKLTTSTKSVADYFKERLLAKASGKSTPLTSVVTRDEEEDESPRHGLGSASRPTADDDFDDAPRGGLGSARTTFSSATSSLQTGMSKFASMFTSATKEEVTEESDLKDKTERGKDEKSTKKIDEDTDKETVEEKAARRKAKEERRREKAEKKEKKRRKMKQRS